MDSYWTKRRKVYSKVREHVEAVNDVISFSENDYNNTCVTENDTHCNKDNAEEHLQSDGLGNEYLSQDSDRIDVTSNVDDSFSYHEVQSETNGFNVNDGSTVLSVTSSDTDDEIEGTDLTGSLVFWVSKFNISHPALNALLSILRTHHAHLPKDARTLLKTAKQYTILPLAGGFYYHFGIEVSVKTIIDSLPISKDDVDEVSIQTNSDGLPLFKSSNMQIWPILGRLMKPSCSKPFVIGLYSGKQKPTNVHQYTEKLVSELQDLFQNGILISDDEEIHCRFSLSCFVCDAPAKAYLKQIKGHSGYYGCNNCSQRGEWHKQKSKNRCRSSV